MHQPVLETDRLLLRPFTLDDADDVHRLAGDFDVARTVRNIPHPYTREMAVEWISSHGRNLDEGERLVYAVTDRLTGCFYGAINLIPIDKHQAGLGYWIGRPYWGNGICTEAAAALLEFAFGELHLSRVIAEHLATNKASGKVMLKNGMLHIGYREGSWRDGTIVRIETYEKLNN